MVQQAGYPITGEGLEVHNVFLSHAAELGQPGAAVMAPRFWRRRPPGTVPGPSGGSADGRLRPRGARPGPVAAGGFAVVACFLAIAAFSPFSEALPNTLLLDVWLGIIAIPYTSRLRLPVVQVRSARYGPVHPAERPAPASTDLSPVPACSPVPA